MLAFLSRQSVINPAIWVHFLRDVHELKEQFPQDEELLSWVEGVKATYEQAISSLAHSLFLSTFVCGL